MPNWADTLEQEGTSVTVDPTTGEASAAAPTVAVTPAEEDTRRYYRRRMQEDVEEEEEKEEKAAPLPTNTTTLLTVPIELGDSSGGSFLSIVLISDPNTLDESVVFGIYIPGLANYNTTLNLPTHPPHAPDDKASSLDGVALADTSDVPMAAQSAKGSSSGAGAAAGVVIGGMLAVGLVAASVVVYRKRRGQDSSLLHGAIRDSV